MRHLRLRGVVGLLAAALALSTTSADAQQPYETELLQNGGFETGDLTGWSTATGTPAAFAYNGAETPVTAIATEMGGGGFLVRQTGNGPTTTIEQIFDLSGNAGDVDGGQVRLLLSGHVGGFAGDPDRGTLRARFLDGGGTELALFELDAVTLTNRNEETTFLRREGDVLVPVGARTMEVEMFFQRQSGLDNRAFADELSAQLVLETNFNPAGQPIGVSLLDRADFETDTVVNPALATGWEVVSGVWGTPLYGDASTPDPAVSAALGGGNQLGRCTSNTGQAILEQTFDLRGNAAAIDADDLSLVLEGYFGGFGNDNDRSRLIAVFRDAAGAEMTADGFEIGDVSSTNRNLEASLMRRRGHGTIPVGARSLTLRLFHQRASGLSNEALVDELSATIVLDADATEAPVALDVELIDNGTATSAEIVNPTLTTGWTVISGVVAAAQYGAIDTPGLDISAELGGGARLFRGGSNLGLIRMEQRFPLEGNAADVDAGDLHVALAGHFGGLANQADLSNFVVTFEDAAGQEIAGSELSIGAVTQTQRNNVSTLQVRTGATGVPAGARTMILTLELDRNTGIENDACADNLSAILRNGPAPLRGTATFTELVVNGGFEDALITPTDHEPGWIVTTGTLQAGTYGDGILPDLARAAEIGGGSQLLLPLSNNSFHRVEHRFPVATDAASIDAGQAEFSASGYLGGQGSEPDNASIVVHYLDASGTEISDDTLGPVTAADRGNVTDLLFRAGVFPVPVGTREVVLEVVLDRNSGLSNEAFADEIRGRFDVLDRPGSDEDLRLSTGIGINLTSGPSGDRTFAFPGDALTMVVDSPGGTRDFQPLILVAQSFTTGTNLLSPSGFPTVHVNPSVPGLFLILDGVTPNGIFGPPVVFPGGTVEQALIPAGGAGLSVMIQGLALDTSTANGFFAATDGHEIILQ